MLKKTITYEDFNGETVSEDLFFHLSKSEIVKLELSHQGGMSEALARIIASEDGKQLVEEFSNIILSAYGKRSEDGKRFIKNQQLRDEFESSQAYDEFFMQLILDTDAQIEFINGIIPANLAEEAAKVVGADLTVVKDPEPEPTTGVQVLTKKDIQEMSPEELRELGVRLASGEVTLAE